MAKMFYSLEEAAGMLGVTEDRIKEMAAGGELQQFRDGDKVMFKREQIDTMAQATDDDILDEDVLAEDDSGSGIPLSDSSDTEILNAQATDTDVIELADDDAPSLDPVDEDQKTAGISVFEEGEIEHVDSIAQTQVTNSIDDEEEMALESVGSGSGLLDLTRETDDTSLGAELLDEIYPGGADSADSNTGSAVGASGVFDSAATDFGSSTGLQNVRDTGVPAGVMPADASMIGAEAFDPAGSGLSSGMLIGATVALVLALIVAVFALAGVPSTLTGAMAANLGMYGGGLIVACLILGGIGFVLGKAQQQ